MNAKATAVVYILIMVAMNVFIFCRYFSGETQLIYPLITVGVTVRPFIAQMKILLDKDSGR